MCPDDLEPDDPDAWSDYTDDPAREDDYLEPDDPDRS